MLDEFPTDLIDLRESPIAEEFHDIEIRVEDFYLTIDFDDDIDIKVQCLEARNYLDSARILLRNLLDMEENDYIKKYPKKFSWMLDNIGRVDKKIDEIEIDTIEKLETFSMYNEMDLPNSPKIKRYITYLIKCMEHLVYFPLKNAFVYYKRKGLKLDDRNLFLYSIFVELYHSSESLGSISAEKTKTSPRQPLISSTRSSHEDYEELIKEGEFKKPEELYPDIEFMETPEIEF